MCLLKPPKNVGDVEVVENVDVTEPYENDDLEWPFELAFD